MQTLIETIHQAEEEKKAIGHFNFANLEGLHAIVQAAAKLKVPVVLGLSEGERDFVGISEARALVNSLQTKLGIPIYLGADHTYSFDRVKEVVDAGYDIVVVDGSHLPFEENVKLVRESIAYAKKVKPDILIEGELGYIGTSSKLLDNLPSDVKVDELSLTQPEDAKKFVEETGVDLLAPAVGNIHGTLKHQPDPRLDINLIKEIKKSVGVPLVLHGGSGETEEDIKNSIAAGISLVHINTDLRVAYRQELVKSLQEYPEEIAPYKIMKPVVLVMEEVVEKRLKLFSGI